MLSLETWRAAGTHVSTPDGRVFVVEQGNGDVPAFLLHGFPTSSYDFAGILDRFGRRVVTFDFLGYGLSEKPESYGYSLFEQADIATLVAREKNLRRVHLVAHDMGTSVATELLARRERGLLPFEIASLTLLNGSVHVELSRLRIGQKILRTPLGPLFARLNTGRTFKAQLARVFARRPSDEELEAMWQLASREDGSLRLPALIGYVRERWQFSRRWIGALERLDIPAHIAWGRLDPVAVIQIAEKLASEIPNAKLTVWDDLGHYPQVEDPERVANDIRAFIDRAT